MQNDYSGKEISVDNDAVAFPMDLSKVRTEASITLGVEHHILRPDEWLILRTIDWFQSFISVILGTWIVGIINVIVKLLIEHKSKVKIQKLEMSEFWVTIVLFVIWVISVFLYKSRINQKWKITQVDRQFLVDKIDNKLRLKFKRDD